MKASSSYTRNHRNLMKEMTRTVLLFGVFKERDRNAFSELEASLKPYIIGMARNRVREEELVGLGIDYEDIAQDILIKIWKGLAGYREEAGFKTWFVAIASNHITDVLRRIQRKKETLFDATGDDDTVMARVDSIPAQDPSSLARLVGREERSQLVAAIESLPPKQREVVRLRMIRGLSYAEIAKKWAGHLINFFYVSR